MNGIILVNAYSNHEDYLYQAYRLQEEFGCLGVTASIVKNDCGIIKINNNGQICLKNRADFAVFLDKDKYTMRAFEGAGVRLFNRATAIEVCDDKMITHLILSGFGIPMPKTMPAPFCYNPNTEIDENYLDTIEKEFGYPVVVKQSYGSLGKGVFLACDRTSLKEYATQFKLTPHFYQRFIAESKGRDLRVIAVGGKAVAAMIRNSEGNDFRSNVALGGNCQAYPIDDKLSATVTKICQRLQLDYCGMDFLFAQEGLTLCEVNSNAYFKGIEGATGVNVARAYAQYIVNKINE